MTKISIRHQKAAIGQKDRVKWPNKLLFIKNYIYIWPQQRNFIIMRTIQKLFIAAFMLIAVNGMSQAPTYSCYLTNEALVSPTVYQFDIYLLSTGGSQMQYAAGQWGITVNPTVANGGT